MRFRSLTSWKRLAVGLLALALLLAACAAGETGTFSDIASGLSGGDGQSAGEEGFVPYDRAANQDSPPTTTAAATSATDDAENGPGAPESNPPVLLNTVAFGRDIIFTADTTVAVSDVGGAVNEAIRIVQGLGGFLFGQSSQGAPNAYSVLTFKVAPEDFQTALSLLGALGDVRTQDVSASDVTDRIVDLESQITTAAASVERLRALLSQATDIKAIVDLENELLARETALESLRGQLRTLQNQVALATIVVTFTEAESQPSLDLAVTFYPGHDQGSSCPGDHELSVEQGAETTVCFEIFNTGDTLLTGFDVKDPVLDIETKDLTLVYGDPETPIEPGESIVFAADIVVERSLTTRTTVTAQPVSEDEKPLVGRSATQTSSAYIRAVDPGGIPSFAEGLAASWDWLVSFGEVLLLAAGAMLPFVWVPVVLWLVWRMRQARKESQPTITESSSTEL